MSDYYKIESHEVEGEENLYNVTLLPDYCAYAGHFPGNPVSPGVCNIQMIKECAEQLTGQRLFLSYIHKCKFSAVISPQTTPQLRLSLRLSETEDTDQLTKTYNVHASLYNEITTYVDFKGEFIINNSCFAHQYYIL